MSINKIFYRRHYSVIALTLAIFILSSCEKVKSDFRMTPDSGDAPIEIRFENLSENGVTYKWDFGDGETSSDMIPIPHTYQIGKEYIVTLEVMGEKGGKDLSSQILILGDKEPIPSFSISPDEVVVGREVSFINTSEYADTFTWDFGDNTTSTDKHPTHIYKEMGTNLVTLTAIGRGGSYKTTATIEVVIPINIVPGEKADQVILLNSWGTLQNLDGYSWKEYGPILLSNGTIIHPVEEEKLGIIVFLMGYGIVKTNSDPVILISLSESFKGTTDKGIGMGSSVNETKLAYGVGLYDPQYNAYRYKSLGITFYADGQNLVDEIAIYSKQ